MAYEFFASNLWPSRWLNKDDDRHSVRTAVSVDGGRRKPNAGSDMSSINSIGANDPVQRLINNPIQKSLPTDAAASATPPSAADKLELSGVTDIFQTLKQNNIRADKVAQIKSQIESGTYESDDKLNAAVDKLLDDLAK